MFPYWVGWIQRSANVYVYPHKLESRNFCLFECIYDLQNLYTMDISTALPLFIPIEYKYFEIEEKIDEMVDQTVMTSRTSKSPESKKQKDALRFQRRHTICSMPNFSHNLFKSKVQWVNLDHGCKSHYMQPLQTLNHLHQMYHLNEDQ